MNDSSVAVERPHVAPGNGAERATPADGAILIRDLLIAHFPGCPLESLVVTRHEFPHWMRPDMQREIDAIFAGLPNHRFHGVRFRGGDLDFRFPNLLEGGDDGMAAGPAVYQAINIGEAEPVRCLLRGLWLAESDATRFGLLLELHEGYRGTKLRVEVAVPPGDRAESLAIGLLKRLQVAGETSQSFRGKVLCIVEDETAFDGAPPTLGISELAPCAREDIVLPEKILDLIERNTLGFAERAESFAAMGMSAKKGVLLYGPPGTGKTLLARYIAGRLPGFTKILVTGAQYALVSECMKIARMLQPSMIVLEDVDLIGSDRDGHHQSTPQILNSLLNEMDGFNSEARILIVMTTNRTEMLEPALAGRPGRVDQAIEIGLPDDAQRKILIRRYAGPLSIDDALVAATSKRLGRISAAFIREFMRRSAQSMLERGGNNTLLPDDLERAREDMLVLGGSLNAKLLVGASAMPFSARN